MLTRRIRGAGDWISLSLVALDEFVVGSSSSSSDLASEISGIRADLEFLQSRWGRIESYLRDAGERATLGGAWLPELMDLRCEAEVLFYPYWHMLRTREIEGREATAARKGKHEREEEIFPLADASFRCRIARGLRVIRSKVEDIEEALELVDMLVDSGSDMEEAGDAVPVVAAVGMAGANLSRVARIAYIHQKVRDTFSLRMWVSVEEDTDLVGLTTKVLQSIRNPSHDLTELDPLQSVIVSEVSGKRFLLVMDGFWNDSYEDWDSFQNPLSYGSNGSRILITTHNQQVLNVPRIVKSKQLTSLSEEERSNAVRRRQ